MNKNVNKPQKVDISRVYIHNSVNSSLQKFMAWDISNFSFETIFFNFHILTM